MKRAIFTIVIVFASLSAFPQGFRWDIPPIVNQNGLPVHNPQISLCTGLSAINGSTCPTAAQSFTDITLATPCAVGFPVTLPNNSACQATGDALGNAGFWLSPGAYIYCINAPFTIGKCYNLTVPVGATASGIVQVPSPLLIGSSDTGLSRTAAGTVVVGNGTQGDASGIVLASTYNFGNSTNTGWRQGGAGSAVFDSAGVNQFVFAANVARLVSSSVLGWSSGDPGAASTDTGFSRLSAGSSGLGNGTAGDISGDLQLNSIHFKARSASTIGSVGNEPAAILYSAAFARSAGNTSFPDLFGDGTHALVIAGKSDGSGVVAFGATTTLNLPASINGFSTVANGVPIIVAKFDATAQQANIGATTLYSVPANGAGTYRIWAYTVVTQAATTSSTLPTVSATYTDNDTGVTNSFTVLGSVSGNIVGTTIGFMLLSGNNVPCNYTFQAKASTNIQFSTSGYASSGATPMQFAIHLKLEYLGP